MEGILDLLKILLLTGLEFGCLNSLGVVVGFIGDLGCDDVSLSPFTMMGFD